MADTHHLVVEKGPDAGRALTIPLEGARLGRSSKNDIVLSDPLLSRHHCRMFFRTGEGLCVTDLGSANQTEVNGVPILEERLHNGDTVTIGDTVMRVVNDGAPSTISVSASSASIPQQNPAPVITPATAHTPAPAAAPASASRPVIDLGLTGKKIMAAAPKSRTPLLLIIGTLVIVFAIVAWIPKLLKLSAEKEKPAEAPAQSLVLDIQYEKVEANSSNIFRYALELRQDRTLSVQIDDIQSARHVPPKEKQVEPALVEELARTILESGFFSLDPKYAGVQPGILEQSDLSVTIGGKTHHVTVLNRELPEAFKTVAERIENFGRNELGLWAVQYPPEKLLAMANEAYLNAKKMYDEKEISYANISTAIRMFTEAEWYLETVEPKPDYYRDIVSLLKLSKEDLQKKYDDTNFRATRAIKMRQWPEASRELRIIMELIPDKADPRHVEAKKNLIDVEQRLGSKK